MPGRQFNSGDYRFGFNGKENDSEWGSQVIQDYGFRIYNPSIGKFLSVDPLRKKYPMLTPYQFASNTPMQAVDVDGLEAGRKIANWLGQYTGYDNVISNLDYWGVQSQSYRNSTLAVAGFADMARGVLNVTDPVSLAQSASYDYIMAIYGAISDENNSDWDVAKTIDPTGVLGVSEILATASGQTEATNDEVAYARGQASGIVLAAFTTRKVYLNSKIPKGPGGKGSRPVFGRTKIVNLTSAAEMIKAIKATFKRMDAQITFTRRTGEVTTKIPEGYKLDRSVLSHNQKVFTNGKSWISPDVDGHNIKGMWKMYDSKSKVGGGKDKRMGTYDKELKRIAD